MSRYPDWVRQHKKPGTSIKKVGESYYLYKTTSARIAGKKNPQPKSTYIGAITKDGVIETKRRKLAIDVVRVFEYGFSFALSQLVPAKLIDDIGDEYTSRMLILHMIRLYSPTSYMLKDIKLPPLDELHVSLSTQVKKYERLSGIRIKELTALSALYLVEIGDRRLLSEISDEMYGLAARLGVRL